MHLNRRLILINYIIDSKRNSVNNSIINFLFSFVFFTLIFSSFIDYHLYSCTVKKIYALSINKVEILIIIFLIKGLIYFLTLYIKKIKENFLSLNIFKKKNEKKSKSNISNQVFIIFEDDCTENKIRN